ncbi:hypothetical protein GGD56_002226 [Rhizobium mongolense]|uniref:Transposase n=1 Tax=Rhizobium mongolense TaxID=57676 RepID=A0ABR6IKS6_9HYPH|nr:hypothetical protein [Rhizobium mongolense]
MSFSEQQFVEQIMRNETNRWLLEVLPIWDCLRVL